MFYRKTDSQPYIAKLAVRYTSDYVITSKELNSSYVVAYKVNNSELRSYTFGSSVDISLSRKYPTTHEISAFIFSRDSTLIDTLSLSAKFIADFPSIDFIAYPSLVVNEQQNTIKQLNITNWFESSGVYFYGEGHTETINISANINVVENNWKSKWLIGNTNFNSISADSVYPITFDTSTFGRVTLSSQSNEDKQIPISIFLTDSQILSSGPIVTYSDEDGQPSYYPFFISTLKSNNTHEETSRFKSSIRIKPYPNIKFFSFTNPFSSEQIGLPLDFSPIFFKSSLSQNINLTTFIGYNLSSTSWGLNYTSELGNWNYNTRPLKKILSYEFPLSYNSGEQQSASLLHTFKISPSEETALNHSVSAERSIFIDLFPNDWIPKNQAEVHECFTKILPPPFVELYIPNYYVEKYESIPVKAINAFSGNNLNLLSVKLITEEDAHFASISAENIINPFNLTFKNIGLQSLTAVSNFRDTLTNNILTSVNVFSNIIDVVEKYDTILNDTIEYKSPNSLTTLNYQLSSAPKIVPNEWVIEDNINYIFRTIFSMIESISKNAVYFTDANNFTGWLGTALYKWSDLECIDSASINLNSWSKFVIKETLDNPNTTPLLWSKNECLPKIIDPSCLQKYCIEWKWSSRKRESSVVDVTWRTAKSKQRLSKKWQFEPCELDIKTTACELGSWHMSSIDKEFFPLSFCSPNVDCETIGFCKLDEDRFVLARRQEVILVDESYIPVVLSKKEIADELFSFAKIESITCNKKQIFVLDSVIPRVTVFDVKNDDLILFNAWATFGSKANPYGLNKPRDLHVDQSENVWVVDTGNKCVKKYTLAGKHKQTITSTDFDTNPPISIAVDSQQNSHVLTESGNVLVFNSVGNYSFKYELSSSITNPTKINNSFNREVMYITHTNGVAKYFRTGVLYGDLIKDFTCSNGKQLASFSSVFQDQFRNIYVGSGDKVLKFADRMKLIEKRFIPEYNVTWKIEDVLMHEDEYIQPWVYIRSFHRLWDNIELLRSSLIYQENQFIKFPKTPFYSKLDLCIGQNEVVTDSTINRLSVQLWENLRPLAEYVLASAKL